MKQGASQRNRLRLDEAHQRVAESEFARFLLGLLPVRRQGSAHLDVGVVAGIGRFSTPAQIAHWLKLSKFLVISLGSN